MQFGELEHEVVAYVILASHYTDDSWSLPISRVDEMLFAEHYLPSHALRIPRHYNALDYHFYRFPLLFSLVLLHLFHKQHWNRAKHALNTKVRNGTQVQVVKRMWYTRYQVGCREFCISVHLFTHSSSQTPVWSQCLFQRIGIIWMYDGR